MTTLYLVTLLVGGLLIGVSLLGGEMAAHLDGDGLDGAFDLDGLDGDVENLDGDTDGLVGAAQFLSFRDVVFFLAFFGLAGTLLGLVGVDEPLRAVAATASGVGAAAITHRLMNYLKRSESGAPRTAGLLTGRRARVLVDVSRAGAGKIVLDTGEQTVQLLAVVAPEAGRDRFAPGDEVTILQIDDGTARVVEDDFLRTA